MRFIGKAVLPVGIPVSALLLLGCAALATVRELSPFGQQICGTASLMAGSFAAGLWEGRQQRHKGIIRGALCGVAVTVFWCGAAMLLGCSVGCSPVGIWAVLGGMGGGVCGVNLPMPVGRGKSHSSLHLRQKLQSAADAHQKRKYRHSSQKQQIGQAADEIR